jgi:hypothetical protein
MSLDFSGPTFGETRIAASGVRSLVWDGDELVDWVSGGTRYRKDGTVRDPRIQHPYPFDAAVALPDSPFAIIYAIKGTKGVLLKDGLVCREINRSYYFADAFEYPIAVFRLPSGRSVLAHCPHEYRTLEIEDLESGELLTKSDARESDDFFHSRLAASSDGRYLLSAGWIWHPVDEVRVFDVERALSEPSHLDGSGLGLDASGDSSSATFLSERHVAVALERDLERGEFRTATELRLFNIERPVDLPIIRSLELLGRIIPVNRRYVLALSDHPRLIELERGRVVQSWPHIASGRRVSSIFRDEERVPPMAFDPAHGRYAFADSSGITILTFEVEQGATACS